MAKNPVEQAASLMQLGQALLDMVQSTGLLVAPRKRGRAAAAKRPRRKKVDEPEAAAAPRKRTRPAKRRRPRTSDEKRPVRADTEEPK